MFKGKNILNCIIFSKATRTFNKINVYRYVLDGFPVTLKQAQLMASRSIIPMIVAELKIDTLEVLKRGLKDKMKPNQ